MLRVTIKSDFLRTVVDAIAILVDEVDLHFTPDGLYAQAVDPAHAGMIDLKLNKEAFEEYDVEEENEMAVDLGKVKGMLKLPATEDVISLEQEEEGRLVVRIGNLTRHMTLLDTAEMSDAKIPSLDLDTEVVVSTDEVYRGVRASEAVSDHIALAASPDEFELSAEGDTDTVNLAIPEGQLVSLECEERVRSLFSLAYFSDMIKAAKSDEIKFRLGTDYPAKMMFKVADGQGDITYVLAPRIESE